MNLFLADCKHTHFEIEKEDQTIYLGCELFVFKTETIFRLHIGVYFSSKKQYYLNVQTEKYVSHSYTYLLTIDAMEPFNYETESSIQNQIKSDLRFGIINFNIIEKHIEAYNSKFNLKRSKEALDIILFQNKLCFVQIINAVDFHIYMTKNHKFFKNSSLKFYSYLDEMDVEYDIEFFRSMNFFSSEIKTIILSENIECFTCSDGDLELLQLNNALKKCYLNDFKCKKLIINNNLINLKISCTTIKTIVCTENIYKFYNRNSQTENVILNFNLEYLDINDTKFENLQLNTNLKKCYLNRVGIKNIIVNENLELLNIIEDELYNINIENPKNNNTAKVYISIKYKKPI